MAKHKIGIVGFGKIARDQHAPAIAGSSDFELVAVSNVGSGTVPAGIASYATFREMLDEVSDLDAVALCTPPAPRRLIASQCLAAGKHVLLEKPPAATVAEVSEIGACAQSAGKVVFATYHAQHNAAVKKAAEFLAQATIKTLTVTWKEDVRYWHPGQDWILDAGGFGIFDPGINALSILTRILPDALFISAADLFFPSNRQAPIAADLVFTTTSAEQGALTATLDWRQSGPPTWQIEVETHDGRTIKLENGGSRLEVSGEAAFDGPEDEYPDIYREFSKLLAAGTSKLDIAPFQLVGDAFMIGRRITVDPFSF